MLVAKYVSYILGVPPVQRIFDEYFLTHRKAKKTDEQILEDTLSSIMDVKGIYKVYAAYELPGCTAKTFEIFDIFRGCDGGDADSYEALIVFGGKDEGKEAAWFKKKFGDALLELKEVKTLEQALEIGQVIGKDWPASIGIVNASGT